METAVLIGWGIAILLSITALIIGIVSRYKKNRNGYIFTTIGLVGLVLAIFVVSNFHVGIVY